MYFQLLLLLLCVCVCLCVPMDEEVPTLGWKNIFIAHHLHLHHHHIHTLDTRKIRMEWRSFFAFPIFFYFFKKKKILKWNVTKMRFCRKIFIIFFSFLCSSLSQFERKISNVLEKLLKSLVEHCEREKN